MSPVWSSTMLLMTIKVNTSAVLQITLMVRNVWPYRNQCRCKLWVLHKYYVYIIRCIQYLRNVVMPLL
uniref:Uncharacterized protein n=1 Tax=Glossina brevipalpis TaxID=37001 RepID=A0A1A9X1Y3_9MUSC